MSNMSDLWLSGVFFKLWIIQHLRRSPRSPSRLGRGTQPSPYPPRFRLSSPPNTNSWLRLWRWTARQDF